MSNLFVSPNGDDSVAYSSNNILNPWRTVKKAFDNAQTGDTIYFRGGSYSIPSEINMNTDGTVLSPIIFKNYEEEPALWDTSLSDAINIDGNYIYVEGITVDHTNTFFLVGDASATGFKVINCISNMSGGGDNVAFVKLKPRAYDTVVQGCLINGPGLGVHQNTCGVLMFEAEGTKVLGCTIKNVPKGINFKHGGPHEDTGIEISYNFIDNTSYYSIFMNCNYARAEHNVIGKDGGNFWLNSANGGDGGDYNKVYHNTVFGDNFILDDDADGARNNDVKNNVFIDTVYLHRYSSLDHNTILDYNLHAGTAIVENRVDYSLSSWRSYYGGSANSESLVSASNDLVGGSSPSSIADYALTPQSAGYGAASDGTDMGADVSLVGATATTPTPDPSPVVPAPLVDSIEIVSETPDSNTIFMDNFESTDLNADYSDYSIVNGSPYVSNTVGFAGSTKSLTADWGSIGQVSAGSLSLFFGRNPAGSKARDTEDFNEVYWRFYMKLSKGWQGQPKKLTRASVFAYSDWRQAMIAHVWHGDDLALGLDPKTFVENGQIVSTTYNDQVNGTWMGKVSGDTQVYDTDNSNHWICVEARVKLNTSGNSDGEQQLWLDGELEISQTGLDWIGTWSDYGINMISLGNYWNDGTPRAQERYLDNLVVSTAPIGLARSPKNPTIYKTAFDYPEHTQGSFQAQISSSKSDTDLVWEGSVAGTASTIVVNNTAGTFKGVLNGYISLSGDTTYYVRANQLDEDNNASSWSPWKKFITEEVTATAPTGQVTSNPSPVANEITQAQVSGTATPSGVRSIVSVVIIAGTGSVVGTTSWTATCSNLSVGVNNFTVRITDDQGEFVDVNFSITREAVVTTPELVIATQSQTVLNEVTSIDVTGTTANSNSVISDPPTNNNGTIENFSFNIPLSIGANLIIITASDGTTDEADSIIITRQTAPAGDGRNFMRGVKLKGGSIH